MNHLFFVSKKFLPGLFTCLCVIPSTPIFGQEDRVLAIKNAEAQDTR